MIPDPLKVLGMHAGAKPDIFEKAQFLRSRMTAQEEKLWNIEIVWAKILLLLREDSLKGWGEALEIYDIEFSLIINSS